MKFNGGSYWDFTSSGVLNRFDQHDMVPLLRGSCKHKNNSTMIAYYLALFILLTHK